LEEKGENYIESPSEKKNSPVNSEVDQKNSWSGRSMELANELENGEVTKKMSMGPKKKPVNEADYKKDSN